MAATFDELLDRSNLTGRQFLIYAGQRLAPGARAVQLGVFHRLAGAGYEAVPGCLAEPGRFVRCARGPWWTRLTASLSSVFCRYPQAEVECIDLAAERRAGPQMDRAPTAAARSCSRAHLRHRDIADTGRGRIRLVPAHSSHHRGRSGGPDPDPPRDGAVLGRNRQDTGIPPVCRPCRNRSVPQRRSEKYRAARDYWLNALQAGPAHTAFLRRRCV